MTKTKAPFFDKPLLLEPCCFLIGAGVTASYIGTWKRLLGMLLGRRFVSAWLSEGMPFDEVKSLVDDGCFSDFFTEERYLELGEFLLADDSVPAPDDFSEDVRLWQELLFSQQVSNIESHNIDAALNKVCSKARCAYGSSCPLVNAPFSLADMYKTYHDHKDGCGFVYEGFGTTMALVDVCINNKTRYVITYNFDTIIEQMLYEVLCENHDGGVCCIEEIHIWTFGNDKQKLEIGHPSTTGSSRCKMIYHQGMWEKDSKSFVANNAIHFFHVHGVAAAPGLEDVCSQLVFSQHSYAIYQDSPLNWSNQVLQYFFSTHNVTAVGFSGTDDNFRYFASNHIKSSMNGLLPPVDNIDRQIIFLKAKKPYADAIEASLEKSAVKMSRETRKRLKERFLAYCVNMVENYYKSYYGVEIVWFDDYQKIADALHDEAVK